MKDRHHTKDKGDRGLGHIMSNLLDNGFQVCLPISEHMPFDLIAVSPDLQLCRVQCKYRTLTDDSHLRISLSGSYSDGKHTYTKPYNLSEFDMLAIYCPDTCTVYYISTKEIKSKNISLRMTPSKNGQRKGIRMAENYLVPSIGFEPT